MNLFYPILYGCGCALGVAPSLVAYYFETGAGGGVGLRIIWMGACCIGWVGGLVLSVLYSRQRPICNGIAKTAKIYKGCTIKQGGQRCECGFAESRYTHNTYITQNLYMSHVFFSSMCFTRLDVLLGFR